MYRRLAFDDPNIVVDDYGNLLSNPTGQWRAAVYFYYNILFT